MQKARPAADVAQMPDRRQVETAQVMPSQHSSEGCAKKGLLSAVNAATNVSLHRGVAERLDGGSYDLHKVHALLRIVK